MRPGEFHKYASLAPPFTINLDDAPTNLQQGEVADLDYFVSHRRQLWPIIPQPFDSTYFAAQTERLTSSFAIQMPTTRVSVIFSDTKMYYTIGSVYNAPTEVTVAGGSTAISADAGTFTSKFSIAIVNGVLYFAHDGTGPLRKWTPQAATYSDVAAPVAGWHNAVKLKPKYLVAHDNRLICGADTSAPGSAYDFAWSVSGQPENFDETGTGFGSGHVSLYDSPDPITGLSLVYDKPIVYKTDSLIVATPTGDFSVPYSFLRYQQGALSNIGCIAPYSLAGNGEVDYFLSRYGVCTFNGSGIERIGHGVDASVIGTGSTSPAGSWGALGGMTNLPTNFYLLASVITTQSTGLYLYNTLEKSWARMSKGVDNSAVNVTAVATGWIATDATKTLVVGDQTNNSRLGWYLVASVASGAQLAFRTQPVLVLPQNIYEADSVIQKTVYRVGLEVIANSTSGSSTANAITSVDTETATGATVTTNILTASASLNTPWFTWIDVQKTARNPRVNLKYTAGSTGGTPTLVYPRISRVSVEFSLGFDA